LRAVLVEGTRQAKIGSAFDQRRKEIAVTGLLSEARYAARQAARVAWFQGAYMIARRMQGPVIDAERDAIAHAPRMPLPSRQDLLADIAALFERDIAAARSGLYPLPNDWTGSAVAEWAGMQRFLADVPKVADRRRKRAADEPFVAHRGKRPRYYLQNFHFQSGGWMTEDSAAIYDTQVDVLFSGATAAMRRQAIPLIARHLAGRDQRHTTLVDVAAGTAIWLRDLRSAFPALGVTLLDMSEAYLATARLRLGRDRRRREVVGAAEAMPLRSGSQDIVTSIYLFHELPPKIRREVAREVARVLAPGGLFVLIDSIQRGEHPPYDGLLDLFPVGFHEPYFAGYLDEDLVGLFEGEGLRLHSRDRGFMSTILAFRKP
jgi:ubiquinone/menaquinone biosynthesis C-methylase UbiE